MSTAELLLNGELFLQLRDVKRDAEGRIIAGNVINGAWDLRADHSLGAYWSTKYPDSRIPTSKLTGWK